jgi:hypothetical protein
MLIMKAPSEVLHDADARLLHVALSCVTVHVYTRKPPAVVASGAPLPMPKLVEPAAKFLQYGKMALGLMPNGGVLGV